MIDPRKMSMILESFFKRGWRGRLRALNSLMIHGIPSTVLSFGGGLGDQLLLTSVAREMRVRGMGGVCAVTFAPEIFVGNSDVERTIREDSYEELRMIARWGGKTIKFDYAPHIPEERRDMPPDKHLIAVMCEQAKISGEIALRPYLKLRPEEIKRGRLCERQIAIQSTGRSSKYFIQTKEWFPERFQEVVNCLKNQFNFVQLGSKDDPKLDGAVDRRGMMSIRESAAILANSVLFTGLVGFLMHLARAVECRAAIVYGGREAPSQSGYSCNENVIGKTPCSPCWRYDDCPGGRSCMEQISAARVVDAIIVAVEKYGEPLATDEWKL